MFLFRKIIASIFLRFEKISQGCIYYEFKKKYRLPHDFRFNGPGIRMYGDGEIEIGSGSYIGSYSIISLNKGTKVIIGKNCRISHFVKIYTDTAQTQQNFLSGKVITNFKSIEIGDGVWIGVNVFINPGIKIGNNVVIGANSVVTKNLDENGIYGGVPAKLIKYKQV